MKKSLSSFGWTVGLISVAGAALAGDIKPSPPEEPAGFVTGGIIGGFAAGPIGAVIGAGLGTWLGNRVHRAGEAAKYEAAAAKSEADATKSEAAAATAGAAARVQVEAAESARQETVKVLDGLQGDVMFRTGSHEITPEVAHQIEVLAQAAVKSPALKIRVDGYADSRGTVDANLELSEARADAVRDLLRSAGVNDDAMEINAYGDTQSVADDVDGYALERRVRLTLQARDAGSVAQIRPNGGN
jgi:outer membrane protein OmpA-like peptidoglycan-associated protein